MMYHRKELKQDNNAVQLFPLVFSRCTVLFVVVKLMCTLLFIEQNPVNVK